MQILRSAYLWALLLTIVCSPAAAQRPAPARPGAQDAPPTSLLQSGRSVKVVCFGDSVTGVYYHTGGRRAYTDMLALALRQAAPSSDVVAVNAGVSGHTTVNALARIENDVLRLRPQWVTVMFGLNDMTRVPLEQYRENLRTIVRKCRDAGAQVLLCTPNNVIDTPARPTDKLIQYCDAVRAVAEETKAPLCDCYAALQALRERDAPAWRLLMSDEIHPNMAGHKRLAELMAKSLTGQSVDLSPAPPIPPALRLTRSKVDRGAPVNAIVMSPLQGVFPASFQQAAGAKLNVDLWATEGKSLAQLEAEAKQKIRAAKPDLVVIAVPRTADAKTREQFIRSYSWIMNWSLSFGKQEWDCVVVHPDVFEPLEKPHRHDDLVRQLVAAQDLQLIDRQPNDDSTTAALLSAWLRRDLRQDPETR